MPTAPSAPQAHLACPLERRQHHSACLHTPQLMRHEHHHQPLTDGVDCLCCPLLSLSTPSRVSQVLFPVRHFGTGSLVCRTKAVLIQIACCLSSDPLPPPNASLTPHRATPPLGHRGPSNGPSEPTHSQDPLRRWEPPPSSTGKSSVCAQPEPRRVTFNVCEVVRRARPAPPRPPHSSNFVRPLRFGSHKQLSGGSSRATAPRTIKRDGVGCVRRSIRHQAGNSPFTRSTF